MKKITLDINEIAGVELKETLFSYKYVFTLKSGKKITCSYEEGDDTAYAFLKKMKEN